MVRPLLPTKLVVPALPAGYLARPRLDALWSQWEDKRLVLVTAGAGFGKTSFLAAGGRHTSRPLIWYMLDRTDREPAVFQTHLTRACATTLSGAEAGTSPPIETEDADAWLAELVSALHRSDRGAVVVLDDVQLVGDSPPVFELIDRLLRYLPPRVTLIVASREPVPLTMRKLQAQGSVAVVEARDLRFTEDEVARLFPHRFDGAKLPRHLARDIVECTEGWAAGLEIFFQILPGVAEIQIASTLERFREAGTSWFDYFTEEVVSQQSPELQDFLLRTSVLPRLEPKLCDRLLGRRDSQKRLAELCRRNLFTFPADDCKGIYRYHHLFQEFLQNQLALKFSATEAAQLRLRSGRALKQGKHWVDALDVFSRHVDAQPALELIEDHADALLEAGRYDTVLRALDRLPERTLNRSAEAMYVSGCLHDVKGNWDQAEACFRRGLRLRPTAARRAEMQSRIAQLRMRAGQYESCLRTCRRALREEGAAQSHQVRGRLLGLQGVASCALGRLDQGEQLLNDAVAACRKARHRAGEGRYLFLLAANVLYIRSEYRQAEETAKRALEIFRQLGDRRLICHSMGVLGFVQVAWGRLHTARSLSEDALRRAENLGYRNIEGYCHLTLGQCCLLADDIGAADYHLERARAIGNEIGEVSLQALALVGLAQVAVQEEKRPVARKLSSRAFDLARANDDLWSAGQAAMMQGLAAVGRRQTADQYWREAEAILGKLKAVAPPVPDQAVAPGLGRARSGCRGAPADPSARGHGHCRPGFSAARGGAGPGGRGSGPGRRLDRRRPGRARRSPAGAAADGHRDR